MKQEMELALDSVDENLRQGLALYFMVQTMEAFERYAFTPVAKKMAAETAAVGRKYIQPDVFNLMETVSALRGDKHPLDNGSSEHAGVSVA